jgi:RHS repeat-associated protein
MHCRLAGVAISLVAALTAVALSLAFSSRASAATTERSVYYSYDAAGRQLSAKFDSAAGADGVTNTYDGFGDLTSSTVSMSGFSKTLTSTYDGAGRRTQLTHPDGVSFAMSYDALDRLTGATWTTAGGTTPFLTINYEASGRRSSINRASSWTDYSYDDVGRLTSNPQDFVGTANDLTETFSYNPASQITSHTRDNDAFAYGGLVAVNRGYAVNGLNQYTSAGPASFTYDANGNLTSDGTNTYTYDVENRLVSATAAGVTTSLTYDPLGRLWQIVKGGATTRFVYDGDQDAAEYDGSGNMIRRFMFAGPDEPILEDTGSALDCSGTHFLHNDHEGSIIALADCWGNRTNVNSYDEYGIPGSANTGRFQYTGQAWIPELGMYYYKARFYSPTLGRFLQTDPIGYKGGINIYEYAMDDPVDNEDPTGLTCQDNGTDCKTDTLNGQKDFRSKDSYKNDPKTQTKVAASDKALQRAVNTLKADPNKQFTVTVKYFETGSRLPQTATETFTYGQLADTLIHTPLDVDTINHPDSTRARGGGDGPITLYDRATTGSSFALQRTLYHEPIHYHDGYLQNTVPKFDDAHQQGYKDATTAICHDGPDPCQ